jgi:Na+/proline symporter
VTDDAADEPNAVPASVDAFAEDAHAEDAHAEDAHAEEEHLTPTRWMWTALGACVAFVVVGAVAFWVQASDPSNYIGGVRAGTDETFRLVINALAPALVQAGLIGVIVVLVTWAVRGRMSRASEDRP